MWWLNEDLVLIINQFNIKVIAIWKFSWGKLKTRLFVLKEIKIAELALLSKSSSNQSSVVCVKTILYDLPHG